MKINPNGITPDKLKALQTYTNQVRGSKGNKASQVENTQQSDRLDISREAKELHTHLEKLKEQPETREKLVESVKSRVQDGTYEASPKKIAEGIIREYRLDETV